MEWLKNSYVATVSSVADSLIFHGWGHADCMAVSRHARLGLLKKNDLVFHSGEVGTHLPILLRGTVEVFRISRERGKQVLHLAQKNSLLAGVILVSEKTAYPASAQVISSSARILAVEREYFVNLLAIRPDLTRRVLATLAQQLLEITNRMSQVQSLSSRGRFCLWLLEQPQRPGPSGYPVITISVNKKMLAEILGMAPETLSRCLKMLSNNDAIRLLPRRMVELKNVSLLQDLAEVPKIG